VNRTITYGCLIGFACAMTTPVFAGEQKVTLMLCGKSCEAYLGDVEGALANLSGVKAVDLKSLTGHAAVTIDGDKVKGNQLAASVNGVKGDGRHCTGQAMRQVFCQGFCTSRPDHVVTFHGPERTFHESSCQTIDFQPHGLGMAVVHHCAVG
jgi:copper chaperone CopZ